MERICVHCIREDVLRARVAQASVWASCDACGSDGPSIPLRFLAEIVLTSVRARFRSVSPKLTKQEIGPHPMDRLRERTPACEVIADVAGIKQEIARAIVNDFGADPTLMSADLEERLDESSVLAERLGHETSLYKGWQEMLISLGTTQSRFFNDAARTFMAAVFGWLRSPEKYWRFKVIDEAGPGSFVERLYRAREFSSSEAIEAALSSPDRELGAPPSGRSQGGRMNFPGVSVFYGADRDTVALAEIRPLVGNQVLVGCFEITRKLRLLNLDALVGNVRISGSIFDEQHLERINHIEFLKSLALEMRKPVIPGGQSSDYLSTQIVADYLGGQDICPLDGVIYSSIQDGHGGKNIALFWKAARTQFMHHSTGLKVEFDADDDGYSRGFHHVYLRKKEAATLPALLSRSRSVAQDQRPVTLRLGRYDIVCHYIEAASLRSRTRPVLYMNGT